MSKKIFFIVLTCCLLVATFCVSFAGAPQVQSAPADIRAVLDRPDCVSAPLIVPPVVEPLNDFEIPFDDLSYPYNELALWIPIDVVWSDSPTISSGIYSLSFSLSNTYSVEVNFDELGVLTLLGIDTVDSSSVSSPVSSFTLLYTSYSGFLVEHTSTMSTITFYDELSNPIIVEADVHTIVFSTNSDFYVYSESEDGQLSLSERSFSPDVFISPILNTLVSGLRSLGTNVGRAFSTMANAIFINADGTGLSTFGILVVVFAAVSLGLSLTRWTLNFCTSWGKRNR